MIYIIMTTIEDDDFVALTTKTVVNTIAIVMISGTSVALMMQISLSQPSD